MSSALLIAAALQLLTLCVVVALYLRRPQSGRQEQAITQLAEALLRTGARLESRLDAIGAELRAGHESLRATLREDLALNRAEAANHAKGGREETARSLAQMSASLAVGLDSFRADNRTAVQELRLAVTNDLSSIGQRLSNFMSESGRAQIEARDVLHQRLNALAKDNAQQQESLRGVVGESLAKLNADNAIKLEQMRATVDEKLQATLHTRLTESFGQVTDQLNKVHTGLGEMSKLSEGVDGLSRIFTNVKSRGGFAEVQLGMLLKQMLAPGQYIENAGVKPGTGERVEYAVRFPTSAGERLLPIDAKFPREAWERLELAYESNVAAAIEREGKSFESAIRTEAGRICGKYLNPPVTTPYAIMFLPTEGLYAEVIRREALQAEIQTQCHVTIAGPTTLSAILTSFQMGFHMLALQEKGDEVWKVLESAKTEFKTFETLMSKMEKQVGTVQNTIQSLGVRTRAINRTLRDVSDAETNAPLEFEDFSALAPRLAASAEDD